jgi:hypothetical protein
VPPDTSARAFFPKMPAEVFDAWIQPQISDYGWPFISINSSTLSTRWHDFFFRRKLAYFHNLTWTKSLAMIDSFPLSVDSSNRIKGLINHCTSKIKTYPWDVKDSIERFASAGAYIMQNGMIPGSLVFIKDGQSFIICDGHHRIAAWVRSNLAQSIKIPVWIGISN